MSSLPIDLKVISSSSTTANDDPVVGRNAVKWLLHSNYTTAARVIAPRERLRLSHRICSIAFTTGSNIYNIDDKVSDRGDVMVEAITVDNSTRRRLLT